MPVISMDVEDLKRLSGPGFDLGDFKRKVPMIGASVEKEEGSELSVEFFPSRPDLFCVEGIARAYRQFSGSDDRPLMGRTGVTGSSGMTLSVDEGLLDIRPVIGCAFIRGVGLDANSLVSIMNLQEKLHTTVGRKRSKVAIGIHDAAPLVPPFRYWAAGPKEVEFVPLQKEGEWDLDRILRYHEKGRDYAFILEGLSKYPVITDSHDRVLSFPPIINGELTRVTEGTEDIFVDCTGSDLKAVSLSVNIVCSQLQERGGKVESVQVNYPDSPEWRAKGLTSGSWPDLRWKERRLKLDFMRRWLGKELSFIESSTALARMGYEGIKSEGDELKCLSPPWRGDILHQADIAEDVAIGYGFDRFEGVMASSYTAGGERPVRTLSAIVRETLIGLGYLEVMTISLSNEYSQFRYMGKEEIPHPTIVNPISSDHTMVRLSSVPSLMQLLKVNKHRDLPQRVFEIADVLVGNIDRKLLGAVTVDNKASFTEVKGTVQRLLQDLQVSFDISPADLGWYIKGRCAWIVIPKEAASLQGPYSGPFIGPSDLKGIPIGHMGEMHPRTVVEMELSAPASSFELDLELLLRARAFGSR